MVHGIAIRDVGVVAEAIRADHAAGGNCSKGKNEGDGGERQGCCLKVLEATPFKTSEDDL
jgi:hypothetical protein